MCLPTSSFDTTDIKIIRCPYCGHEYRGTFAWMRSHTAFECGGYIMEPRSL
jgi:hypothetical protein